MTNDPTEIVRALVEADIRVLLYGPPGSGKTTIADTVLREFCGRVYHQTLTEETSPAEGIGHYIVKGGDFLWHDGPMVSAWREPGYGLVLNELDKASGPMHTALHCICDDRRIAQTTLPSGETVRPADRFRVIATMNGSPDLLPEPLRDRFAISIEVKSPSEAMYRALPEKWRPIAEAAYQEQKYPYVTYRKVAEWAKAVEAVSRLGITEERLFPLMQGVFGPYAGEVYHALVLGSRPGASADDLAELTEQVRKAITPSP